MLIHNKYIQLNVQMVTFQLIINVLKHKMKIHVKNYINLMMEIKLILNYVKIVGHLIYKIIKFVINVLIVQIIIVHQIKIINLFAINVLIIIIVIQILFVNNVLLIVYNAMLQELKIVNNVILDIIRVPMLVLLVLQIIIIKLLV